MKKWFMALIAVCMLALAACSGDKETSGEKSNGKKELIVAADQDPVGLDPHITPAASSVRIYSLIYERLVSMDSEMKLVPALAEKWDVSDLVGEVRLLLFKICSFCGSFLVGFAFGHCENRLTLGIVCD